MHILNNFAVLLIAGLAYSSPITNSDLLVINEEFFPNSLVIYTAPNEIVKLFTPLNALNFADDEDSDDSDDEGNLSLFFVEGEKDSNGNIVEYKGLSILKNGQATKLLENGKDMAAGTDDSKKVFLAASDGIYAYNDKTSSVDKYGTVNEDIIGIEVENSTNIYILTSGNVVYKVSEEGTVKEKLEKIQNAKQIVLDSANNLFYVDTENHVFVYSTTEDEVTAIEGLPRSSSYVQILRPPFILEEGIPVIVGKKAYAAYANGTVEAEDVAVNVHPSAYSMEATLIQYYAHNKKIYEYNILALILGEMLESLKSFFDDKVEQIQSIATRSRQAFRA